MNVDDLSPLQLDALREVGGIGAGHAATALSQLLDRPIDLEVPEIQVLALSDVLYLFGGPERLVGAVYARMLGDINGGVLFMADRDASLALVDLLRGHDVGTAKSLDHEEEALIRHAASILIASYLAAISRMADLDVLPSASALSFDMAGALLEAVVAEVAFEADAAVLVRTAFYDENAKVDAALFFIPTPQSLQVILGRLGIA